MEIFKNTIAALVSAGASGVSVLAILSLVDYITGMLNAYVNKELNSKVGYSGIMKKISMFIGVFVAWVLSLYLNQQSILSLIITFFIANEGLSILENLNEAGVEMPDFMDTLLKALRNKGNGGDQ